MRLCQCGGQVKQGQLTEGRESWGCKACGRYEIFQQGEKMKQEEIIEMARQSGLVGKPTYTEGLVAFANLVAQRERDRIYSEELELPEPRLTGKFSLTAGLFKCTSCTGTWANREDAKHHSCKDYQ